MISARPVTLKWRIARAATVSTVLAFDGVCCLAQAAVRFVSIPINAAEAFWRPNHWTPPATFR